MRQHASEVSVAYLMAFYRNFPDYTTVTEMGLYQDIVGVRYSVAGGTICDTDARVNLFSYCVDLRLCHNSFFY